MPELTAPIVYKNDEKRIVFGPVLIPNEPDSDNDTVSEEQIEKVAHKFVEDYGNIDLQHSLNNVGKLVESYILPVDIDVGGNNIVPKGSWMMGVRVTDDGAWKAVKDGKLGGFSIMALQKTAMKSEDKDQESKRITLADLGEDWIVNAVSLVDEPAVPKAKWLAIKSKEVDVSMNEMVQKAIDGSLEHRRSLIDQELDKQFSGYDKFPIIHSTLIDSVVFRVIDDYNDSRNTYQVGYELLEDGKVNFTDEPKEVHIQESVVEIQDMLGGGFKSHSDKEESPAEEQDSFMSKFMKGLGFKGKDQSDKAGKVISNANLEKLRKAKGVIDDLLSVGEKERESKAKGGTKNMEKDNVQAMIDESIGSVNTKLDEVIKSLGEQDESSQEGSSEGTDGSEDEGTEDAEKSKDESSDEDKESANKSSKNKEPDGYKEKYEDVLKKLESLKQKPFSNRLTGQDNEAEKSAGEDESKKVTRDAFGYKTKK